MVLSGSEDRAGLLDAESTRPELRRRILVVDDDQDAAARLSMLLSIMGNETATAHHGLEAPELAAAGQPNLR